MLFAGERPELTEAEWENMTVDDLQSHLSSGANIDARDEYEATPLLRAAMYNENPAVIEALLDVGANGRLSDIVGKTAFDYAKENATIVETPVCWRLNDARF